jgi:hypothetical protein
MRAPKTPDSSLDRGLLPGDFYEAFDLFLSLVTGEKLSDEAEYVKTQHRQKNGQSHNHEEQADPEFERMGPHITIGMNIKGGKGPRGGTVAVMVIAGG